MGASVLDYTIHRDDPARELRIKVDYRSTNPNPNEPFCLPGLSVMEKIGHILLREANLRKIVANDDAEAISTADQIAEMLTQKADLYRQLMADVSNIFFTRGLCASLPELARRLNAKELIEMIPPKENRMTDRDREIALWPDLATEAERRLAELRKRNGRIPCFHLTRDLLAQDDGRWRARSLTPIGLGLMLNLPSQQWKIPKTAVIESHGYDGQSYRAVKKQVRHENWNLKIDESTPGQRVHSPRRDVILALF